jgi:hypothetical protein
VPAGIGTECAVGSEFFSMIPNVQYAGDEVVTGVPIDNSLRGAFKYFPDGYLSGNAWYLHYVGMPQRPYVFFEDYPIKVDVLGFGSEFEINNNLVRIAIKHRFVIGYHRFDRSIKVA